MAIQVTDMSLLREQLVLRREKLEAASARSHTANLVQLLEQVDKALERLDVGTYGICDVCHESMGAERVLSDPLAQICLDCLPPAERRQLEQDLELAARIQTGLLPRREISSAGWQVSYHYEAAGLVSGDYIDVLPHSKDLYFMVGDVSGKGVAASMLMANLHAMFRVLVPTGLPVAELVSRANRIFCESTLPTQYATLIVGKASACGEVEICNGGHPAPFHVSSRSVDPLGSSGLPVGLFADQEFACTKTQFSPGDSLVLYTDGVTEAVGVDGSEYGEQRLGEFLRSTNGRGSAELVKACVDDLLSFRASSRKLDDQALMVLKFTPVQN